MFEKIKENKKIKSRIYGALYGVAVGDAFGAPYEFLTKENIQQQYGYVKRMHPDGKLLAGSEGVTDDTEMTLAVAEGIMKNPESPETEIGARFLDWFRTSPADIGRIVASTFVNLLTNDSKEPDRRMFSYEEWEAAAKKTARDNSGQSAGNGGLMRTVYPGLYYKDVNDAINIAKHAAQMTHWHEESTNACALYTNMIWNMIHEATKSNEEVWDIAETVLAGSRYEKDLPEKLLKPTGYVVDSFHCALYSIRHTDNYADAIIMATNMGGDTDTISAIAGGLAGARYGLESIPAAWISELGETTRNRLETAAKKAVRERKI